LEPGLLERIFPFPYFLPPFSGSGLNDLKQERGKRNKKGDDIVVIREMDSIFATVAGKATAGHSFLESASACLKRWNTWVR
jgi:hypothetical protein